MYRRYTNKAQQCLILHDLPPVKRICIPHATLEVVRGLALEQSTGLLASRHSGCNVCIEMQMQVVRVDLSAFSEPMVTRLSKNGTSWMREWDIVDWLVGSVATGRRVRQCLHALVQRADEVVVQTIKPAKYNGMSFLRCCTGQ